ncbi:MAG TPA: hypothetical protein VF680_13110 [Allosphingosinicella sp.]
MNIRQHWLWLSRLLAIRTGLFLLGWLLMASAPVFGLLPGPGGIVVFAAGAGLVLRNSEWAKRKYVAFKRRHPRKGGWADWGMRRKSALRRQAREKDRIAGALPKAD